jgi:hypothetical protein
MIMHTVTKVVECVVRFRAPLQQQYKKYSRCGSVISTPPSRPFNIFPSQAPMAPEDPEKPPVRPMVDENSAAGKAGVNAKEDWFLRCSGYQH